MNRPQLIGISLALALASAWPAAARADRLVGFGQLSLSHGRFAGQLGDEFDRVQSLWTIGAGVRYLDLSLVAFAEFGPVTVYDESRHGTGPIQTGLGGDARYYFSPGTAWQPYARLGFAHRTISGGGEVRRFCSQSTTCTGGFWSEEPSYDAWTARAGLGLQYTVENRFGMYSAYWLDIGYDAVNHMEVVEQDLRGGMITLSLGAAFGGGRTSTRARAGAR